MKLKNRIVKNSDGIPVKPQDQKPLTAAQIGKFLRLTREQTKALAIFAEYEEMTPADYSGNSIGVCYQSSFDNLFHHAKHDDDKEEKERAAKFLSAIEPLIPHLDIIRSLKDDAAASQKKPEGASNDASQSAISNAAITHLHKKIDEFENAACAAHGISGLVSGYLSYVRREGVIAHNFPSGVHYLMETYAERLEKLESEMRSSFFAAFPQPAA